MYDITSYVKYDSDNMLTVKVDHSRRTDSRRTPDLVFTECLFGGGQSVHIAQRKLYMLIRSR